MYKTLTTKIIALLAISYFSSPVLGFDGPEVPHPTSVEYGDDPIYRTLEAVGAWGLTYYLDGHALPSQDDNNFCTGILVAPNIVLTARHCQSSLGSKFIWNPEDAEMKATDPSTGQPILDAAGVQLPKYTMRFRLNTDETTIGTPAGGFDSYHQVPIKRIVRNLDNASCPTYDMALLILSDGPNDTDDNGRWANGWITHIDPVPVSPAALPLNTFHTMFLSTMGPDSLGQKGILRYLKGDDAQLYHGGTDIACTPYYVSGMPHNPEFGDSGGGYFYLADSGEYILATGGSGGYTNMHNLIPGDSMWAHFFGLINQLGPPNILPIYGAPELLNSEFDITNQGTPGTSRYGRQDFSISISDAIAISSQYTPLLYSDWNNDGVINVTDFNDFALGLLTATNPYGPLPVFPMPAGSGDVNDNGRFNQMDLLMLQAMADSTITSDLAYDYNADNVIDQSDVDILNRVLEYGKTKSQIAGPLSHGLFGDLNNDDQVDSLDLSELSQLDPTTLVDVLSSDPLYDARLDIELDKVLLPDDYKALIARIIPGDVATVGQPYSSSDINPDFILDIRDARMYALYSSVIRPSLDPTPHVGVDVVQQDWRVGDEFDRPDGLISEADMLWVLSSWVENANTSSFWIDSLFDFWFLDVNNDGRANILDVHELANSSVFDPDWDLDNNGVLDFVDYTLMTRMVIQSSPFGQGFLGDVNSDNSPSCSCGTFVNIAYQMCEDIFIGCEDPITTSADCGDLTEIMLLGPTAYFQTGREYASNNGYIVQLDADLDGDIDFDDQVAVFHELQPGDLDFNGILDTTDGMMFAADFTTSFGSDIGDPNYLISADMNRDGTVSIGDVSTFNSYMANPKCN